jgi:hypothetical protein
MACFLNENEFKPLNKIALCVKWSVDLLAHLVTELSVPLRLCAFKLLLADISSVNNIAGVCLGCWNVNCQKTLLVLFIPGYLALKQNHANGVKNKCWEQIGFVANPVKRQKHGINDTN